jgi:hypothetical protein
MTTTTESRHIAERPFGPDGERLTVGLWNDAQSLGDRLPLRNVETREIVYYEWEPQGDGTYKLVEGWKQWRDATHTSGYDGRHRNCSDADAEVRLTEFCAGEGEGFWLGKDVILRLADVICRTRRLGGEERKRLRNAINFGLAARQGVILGMRDVQ